MSLPSVRLAEPSDAEPVAALLAQLGYPLSTDEASKRLADFTRSGADRVLVAVLDGQVVGLASISIALLLAEGVALARITALVVSERYRRIGLGRLLLFEAERRAQLAGCTVIQVSSGKRPERASAHRFYACLGYTDSGSDHILYEKRLVQGSP